MLFLTLLVWRSPFPAGHAIAPAFIGQDRARPPHPPFPPWQQLPATSPPVRQRPDCAAQRRRARPGARHPRRPAERHPEDRRRRDASPGWCRTPRPARCSLTAPGMRARVPASNMKLLTAAAALRALGPDHALQHPGPRRLRPRDGGSHRRGRRPSRRGRVRPGRRHGPCRARHPRRSSPSGRSRQDGVTGTVTVLLDDSLFTGPALNPAWSLAGRGRRRNGPAVPAGPELGPVRPRQHHRPAPAGRRHERGRGVLRAARGGRRARRDSRWRPASPGSSRR